MTPDDSCFDHSVFSVNRERLGRLEITKKFSDRIVMTGIDAGLISDDHFSVVGVSLKKKASLKSLKQIERLKAAAQGRDDQINDHDSSNSGVGAGVGVGNPWVNFRGEKRSNTTHRSITDPEARLYTKTSGVAHLQHRMHVLMENRHGIGVDIRVGKADGHAERMLPEDARPGAAKAGIGTGDAGGRKAI